MSTNRTPRRKTVRKLNPARLAIASGAVILLILLGSVLGLVMYSTRDMPAWDPSALQPNLPSFILDKDGNSITNIYVENRVPVEFEKVPDTVKSAFLAIEDIRFYDHNGLDLRRIAGALIADIKAGRKEQGASTITQQLVKRAFLSPEKTLKRKIQEAVLAIKLERQFTKDQIFEMYLNQIYLGAGAYGIQSASQVYFGKDAAKLTLEEAALLAAIPKAPSYYDPYKNMDAATKRRNIVLSSMAKYEFITPAQAEESTAQAIVLTGTKVKNGGTYKYPFFVDYITDILIAKYGENTVYKGGLKVYTTLDPKIQTYAEEALANSKNFPKAKYDSKGVLQPQAGVVVLDPKTGYIKAIVGGRDHTQKRQFNRATQAVRQPGSAFKPVAVYAPAIEKGKAPASVVLDAPFKDFNNYDGKYHGLVTYRKSVLSSYNVPAVKVLQETGVSKSIAFARKLGISTLVTKDINAKTNDENLSFGLGGLTKGVTPLELAGAYGAFANEGIQVQPTAIIKIEDRDGNIIDQFKPKKTIAMKKTTAYLMTSMLESGVSYGTGKSASLGKRPVAGKTGTTSDNKDAWFAGYTPELVTVVWMGHDEPKKMSGITGGSYPAKIWREIMSKALKDKPITKFERPEGLVSATVCSKTGNRPGDLCSEDDLVTDLFVKGTVPSKACDSHTFVRVCVESNQLPTENCPEVAEVPFHKDEQPTETCTLHVGGAYTLKIPVCFDPSHGGIPYTALVPGPDQEGGCPGDIVQYQQFPQGQEPAAACPIPEHQLRPKTSGNLGSDIGNPDYKPQDNNKPRNSKKQRTW